MTAWDRSWPETLARARRPRDRSARARLARAARHGSGPQRPDLAQQLGVLVAEARLLLGAHRLLDLRDVLLLAGEVDLRPGDLQALQLGQRGRVVGALGRHLARRQRLADDLLQPRADRVL